jgi:hypothetical protein
LIEGALCPLAVFAQPDRHPPLRGIERQAEAIQTQQDLHHAELSYPGQRLSQRHHSQAGNAERRFSRGLKCFLCDIFDGVEAIGLDPIAALRQIVKIKKHFSGVQWRITPSADLSYAPAPYSA